MKFVSFTILLLLLLLINPFSTFADDKNQDVTGTYTSNKTQSEIFTLRLNHDGSAIIESLYNGQTTSDTGSWSADEKIITVRYKDFKQDFKAKKLFLFEYGSFKRIRGLKPLLNPSHGGSLDSMKFVDKNILDELIENKSIQLKKKIKSGYINYTSIIFVTFFISLFVGRKKPILFAIICMILVPTIAYLIDELNRSLPILTVVGLIGSFLWSIIIRWGLKKTRVSLDSKLRFISGHSSGRGTRSFFVIGPKGSKSRD
ncbi:MAG: hypothetical protein KKE44_03460 [Proteobacteria bacterium]|nr:hypothetical protein [Pseudomonadota bacterium]MBU1581786.1 hypothetical protein [Pseudomonadota bacterium]MBU2627999.1 hypothetical protein [Pseudomonadota bacterium]